jgi:Fic family protein
MTVLYTSSQFQESLQKIDALRRDILLSVISPKDESRFRWQTLIERIFWSLTLSDRPLGKKEIVNLLTEDPKKRLTLSQKEAIKYKKIFDYIHQDWLASQKPILLQDVLFLHKLICQSQLRVNQELLQQCLSYFQTSHEHPVIQAGLIQFQILALSPFTDGNDRLARLLTYLFLYKEGFDCKGFLVLEEYFRRNLTDYQQILKQAAQAGNQTAWLEYFVKGLEAQFEKTLKVITHEKTKVNVPTPVFELNERQKEILALMENPGITITNRQVQKLFKISQITASRDLAKLVSLGFLFTHGGGRSVYYT